MTPPLNWRLILNTPEYGWPEDVIADAKAARRAEASAHLRAEPTPQVSPFETARFPNVTPGGPIRPQATNDPIKYAPIPAGSFWLGALLLALAGFCLGVAAMVALA